MPDYGAALDLRTLRSPPEASPPAWKNLTNRSHAHGPAMAPSPDGAAVGSCGNVMRAPRRRLFTATARIACFGPCFPGRAVRTALSDSCFPARALQVVLYEPCFTNRASGWCFTNRAARVALCKSRCPGRTARIAGRQAHASERISAARDRDANVSSPFASLRLRVRWRAAASLRMHHSDIESVSEASTGVPECVVGKL